MPAGHVNGKLGREPVGERGPAPDERSIGCARAGSRGRSAWRRSSAWRALRPRVRRGTVVAMTTEALRTVKDRFSEYVDRVEREHERIVVTKNGRPAVVLISTEDLDSLEETIAVLSDPEAMAGLREGDAAVARGDVVQGVDAVRALRRRSG
jgi:antitoxin YefM